MAGAINKVVLLGDFGVGKSSLFFTFMGQKYVPNEQKSMKAEYVRTWEVDGKPFTVSARCDLAARSTL